MEDTGYSLELVHVLRHTFRPSQQLEELLIESLPPGPVGSRSFFEIKSLSAIALNAYKTANYEYTKQIIAANKALEANKGRAFDLIPDVEIRKIGEKTLDILMGVYDRRGMYDLTHATRLRLPEAASLKSAADPRYSLFARIHSSAPITNEYGAHVSDVFKTRHDEGRRKYILNVLPNDMTGSDQYLKVPKVYAEEEAS